MAYQAATSSCKNSLMSSQIISSTHSECKCRIRRTEKKNGVLGWWREAIFQQCCCDAFTEPLAPAFRPDVFDVSKSRTSNIHLKKTALGIVPRVIEKNLVKCKTCYQCLKFSNIYPLLSSFSQKKHGVAQLSTTIQPLSPEL